MNQGSIESRSSATFAVELIGVRAPASDVSYLTQRSNERFDSIFDSLQQRTGSGVQSSGLDRDLSRDSTVGTQDVEEEVALQPPSRGEGKEQLEEKEVNSTSGAEACNPRNQSVDENDSDSEHATSDGENSEPVGNEKASGESEEKSGSQLVEVSEKSTSKNNKTQMTGSNGEEKRAFKLTEEGMVSSSKSFQLQTQKVTVVKDADSEKSAKTSVLRNGSEKTGFEVNEKAVIEPRQSVKATAATVAANKTDVQPKANVIKETSGESNRAAAKAAEAVSKTTNPASQNLKAAPDQDSESKAARKVTNSATQNLKIVPDQDSGNKAVSKTTNPASQNLKAAPDQDSESKAARKVTNSAIQNLKTAPDQDHENKMALKKSANHPAKNSSISHESLRSADSTILKNPLKSAGLQTDGRLAQFDQEIGIKTAEQALNKQSKMVSEVKSSESAGSEKGFLKEANPNGAVNRAQAVTSRSDVGGIASNSHFGGQHGQSEGHGGGRGSEQFRHWAEGNSEVRSVSQAAQQGDFVDRAVGSALSARVVSQIMNHIDRLRDSEKSRVRVSLGSEASGVTVDIRIEGDAIYTSFEGDPQILNQLKEEWDDIKDRAIQRGVSLNDPEFIEISYSSSSESESFLPDGGIAKEGKSQSVIQHKNNQPVRPGEMTAAAGSSGPVHSFYA